MEGYTQKLQTNEEKRETFSGDEARVQGSTQIEEGESTIAAVRLK